MFHKMTSRLDLVEGEQKIGQFFTDLAVRKNIAPATQNQAMNALVFLYKKVLKVPLSEEMSAVRATKETTVPVVLTREEVCQVLAVMEGDIPDGIKLIPVWSIKRSRPLQKRSASKGESQPTLSAIVLPRIFSKEGLTFGPFRPCLAIRILRRP